MWRLPFFQLLVAWTQLKEQRVVHTRTAACLCTGLPDGRVPGDSDGVCGGGRHVPPRGALPRAARGRRAVVLPAADHRHRLLPPHGVHWSVRGLHLSCCFQHMHAKQVVSDGNRSNLLCPIA